MRERVFDERDDSGDFVGRLVRVLERRAAELGISREDYLDGMVSGKYPRITSREVEQRRASDRHAVRRLRGGV